MFPIGGGSNPQLCCDFGLCTRKNQAALSGLRLKGGLFMLLCQAVPTGFEGTKGSVSVLSVFSSRAKQTPLPRPFCSCGRCGLTALLERLGGFPPPT